MVGSFGVIGWLMQSKWSSCSWLSGGQGGWRDQSGQCGQSG